MNIVVLVTASNRKEAGRIASSLVKERLAACVNIIDKVSSIFSWEGRIDKARELLLVIKTRKACLKKLIKKVKSLHSYSVPEIIALPIIAGERAYLKWLNDSTR